MSICNLCSKIPWHNLPPVPPECATGLSGHKYIQQFYDWSEKYRKSNGYLHHTSLEALRTSANVSKCGLCELMLKSAENVERDLETLKPEWEAGTEIKYPWPTWEFWITERKQGGPGFWVMSETDDGGVYLVAAIGLCARDGKIYQSFSVPEVFLLLGSSEGIDW